MNRFVGRLISKAHSRNAQRIALVSWDSEEDTRRLAGLMAAAFTQQLSAKCALIISEGVRIDRMESDAYDTIYLPDVEVPGLSDRIASALVEVGRAYPLQVFAGPSAAERDRTPAAKAQLLSRCHGVIYAVPSNGLPRRALKVLQDFGKNSESHLMGIFPYETLTNGEAGHG